MFGFVGLIFVVIGLIHLYLWKRLIHDPLRRGLLHRLGGIAAVLLALLIPATLIGTRTGYAKWLAWPGYLWLALMFYLLVILGVLEIPRLIASLWIRARAKQPHTGTAQANAGTAQANAGTAQTKTGAAQTKTGAAQTKTGAAQTKTGAAQTKTGAAQT
ncbi:hypothetical protein ACIBO8_01200, partial [Actinoplanes sp. NPDC049681]